ISVYYLVKPLQPLSFNFKTNVFDFDEESTQSFRWVKINRLTEEDVTFRTDKTVVKLLKEINLKQWIK
ncbi:MAG: NUDIX hydrolase, partial [Bacteroidia bacterium]